MPDRAALLAFVDLCGQTPWRDRIAAIQQAAPAQSRAGQAARQRHALELTIQRLLQGPAAALSAAETCIATLAGAVVAEHTALAPAGRERLRARLQASLSGRHSIEPLFHLMRTATLQRGRGFTVAFAGLEQDAPFDLLLARDGQQAELAGETVSAEDGRDLHRSAWFDLVDGVDPDLQTWLSSHPGRYLLKMTLPQGLRDGREQGSAALAELQRRIRAMLERQCRTDQDEAAVLRLDPLLLAGAQADELGLMNALRAQFGPEAQLAVTSSGSGVFVMAARAGRGNEVGVALRRRMAEAAPRRFSGERPGILAMFVEDTLRGEWRTLRDRLELEGEARQFLTHPDASHLVAVTAASRSELLGLAAPHAATDGELRFRNQQHPDAKSAALAPAVLSSF